MDQRAVDQFGDQPKMSREQYDRIVATLRELEADLHRLDSTEPQSLRRKLEEAL